MAQRLMIGAALTEPEQSTFCTPDEKGDTDYAALAA
jgi:hypothetical protein